MNIGKVGCWKQMFTTSELCEGTGQNLAVQIFKSSNGRVYSIWYILRFRAKKVVNQIVIFIWILCFASSLGIGCATAGIGSTKCKGRESKNCTYDSKWSLY